MASAATSGKSFTARMTAPTIRPAPVRWNLNTSNLPSVKRNAERDNRSNDNASNPGVDGDHGVSPVSGLSLRLNYYRISGVCQTLYTKKGANRLLMIIAKTVIRLVAVTPAALP